MLALNLVLAFFLEPAALVAVGLWGYTLGSTPFFRVLLTFALPSLLAVIWGTFLSPKAVLPLEAKPKLLAKRLVFGLAALRFRATERPLIAMIFARPRTAQHPLSLWCTTTLKGLTARAPL